MALKRVPISISAQVLEQLGRLLNVSKKEGNGPGREIRHHGRPRLATTNQGGVETATGLDMGALRVQTEVNIRERAGRRKQNRLRRHRIAFRSLSTRMRHLGGNQLESNLLCSEGGAWRIDPDGLREWFRLRLTGDEALGNEWPMPRGARLSCGR